ncbi:hypothetical protein INT44_004492 [Umbelopsis vinacea]|uniref:2-dehydropantoate 2-reductase n=1 Tax=Umbelopsis vinacea TaxID=44442 RepID=A0A8H7UN60_9FUNG|nr:hypothetical protein INT44_004492 [Umbelopsis vinacea]KAI9284362.1 ketopantoate reductase PanE/ApbA C terminal-domain-containing protein [Umbelopsis sp. AD052]
MSRFHVVGAGAIGCLVSVLLAENGHHVTLIVRHADLCPLFNGIRYTKSGQQPKLITAGVSVELASQTSTIENLIITTKAQDTTAALTSIKHRWIPSTTALFLENGMAWKESLDASGIPATPANVAVGVNKHGVERSGHFEIVHHNWEGGMDMAAMPSDQGKTVNVLKELTTIPDMNAKLLAWDALMDRKIEKLVVNACINPLTAILKIPNGQLLDRPDAMSLMRSVCSEAAQVFDHKQADHLFNQVQQVCRDTNHNSSSMLQDVRNARPTEIDAINGWLCRQANGKNIQLPVNQTLVQLIKAMSK